jgi:hypothetical protein
MDQRFFEKTQMDHVAPRIQELGDLAQIYYKTGAKSSLRTLAEAIKRECLLHDSVHWLHMK